MNSNAQNSVPQDNVKFMVVSDIHYFAPSLFSLPANKDLQHYLASDRKLILESDDIFKSFTKEVFKEKPDFLLIPGDLTKDGEKISHTKLTSILDTFRVKGIKVLVIPGNHDINNSQSYSYVGNAKTPVANVSANEFKKIYRNFGYKNAVALDQNSLSYVYEPVKGLWIMGIDACHYYPKSETSGSLSSENLKWIKSIVQKAQTENKILLAMMHHGIVEHFIGQSSIFPEYLVSDWQNISDSMANEGLKIVFTGHFHAQDIVKKVSGNGNKIYDIETGSSVTFPCPYRIVNLNLQNKILDVSTKFITDVKTKSIPADIDFSTYAKNFLTNGLTDFSFKILTNSYYIPSDLMSEYQLNKVFANAFVAHYAGNETPTDSDKENMQEILSINPLLGTILKNIWTDNEPNDLKLSIDLKTGEILSK